MRVLGRLKFYFSHQILPIAGLCIGMTLSLLLMPFVEESCLPSEPSPEPSPPDYEPYLNSQPKKAIPPPRKVQIPRARYYSTELGIRERLFVGVLTSHPSFGAALNRTLSKYVDKVLIYLEGGPSLGSVVADKVLGPFNMLQHVSENFLHEYDFFFFAKDTTHVRGKKLLELVERVSSTRHLHLGRPVDAESMYCALEAGVLLSHSVLERTVAELDWCIQHAFSQSSSDNFGRCILHGTDLPCQATLQDLEYESHSISKYDTLESSIQKSSWGKDLKKVLTVFSLSSPEEHYSLHHYFCQQELLDNHRKLHHMQVKISNLSQFLPDNRTSWPVGIEPPFKPHGRFDVLPWTYFNSTHSFFRSELELVTELTGLHRTEVQDLVKGAVQWVRATHGDRHIYQRLANGYRRFDPTRGTEYLLDMLFLEEATGLEVTKRIAAVRPLNEVEIVPVPFVTEHTRVVLLLSVRASERNEAVRFLEDYAKACVERQDSTVLLLVFLYGPQDPGKGEKEDVFGPIKDTVNSYVTKYRSSGVKIAWFSIKTIGKTPPSFAVVDLVSRKLSTESLILLCHVGMEVRPEYINRVRMNTILKTQVFFPIPFRQYHPSLASNHITLPDTVEVKKDLGRFDTDSFEHASFYLSDYLAARKLASMIPTVASDKDLHNEELYGFDLFQVFVRGASQLHAMRAVEPDLRIRFRFDQCDLESSVVAYQRCLRNQERNLGTKSQMAAEVLSHAGSVL